MKTFTITLDERTMARLRVYAANRNMRASCMVGEPPQRRMQQSREYDEAMRRFLAKRPVRLKRPGTRDAVRDELHDRARLR
jgi:hypothetical protein